MRSPATVTGLLLTAFLCSPVIAAEEPAAPATANREAREQEFAKLLTGASLKGTFTIVGREAGKPERYDIASAQKLKDDDWVITARIKYGDKDLSVPIVVKVYWADDAPVISLTNLTIPGMGTFTSRVMFHGDRYAGTWQHDAVGGHMFGLVERTVAEEAPGAADAAPQDAPKK